MIFNLRTQFWFTVVVLVANAAVVMGVAGRKRPIIRHHTNSHRDK